MSKTIKRIRRLMIGIFAILSLSVSSVAACACSHHEPSDSQPDTSCHGKPLKKHGEHSDQSSRSSSFGESCYCFQAASKESVKAEGFKLKKHVAAFVAGFVPEAAKYDISIATVAVPSYLISTGDPHLSSIFPRGPPAS